ncbi:unnamed protein product [Prorocentrum cordatum]|uniref:Uncharacterized protein n=1 Tax=Prorocentrum cordatum TaxID=2364126 RepID=A0ABN9YCU1_9DINO|nr:unnamed protein product [Polarella glacialis]
MLRGCVQNTPQNVQSSPHPKTTSTITTTTTTATTTTIATAAAAAAAAHAGAVAAATGTRPGALEQVPHGRAAAALRARPVQQAGGCCASGGHAEREPTEAELIRAFFEERGRDTVRGPTGRGSATIAAWGPRRCSSAPLSGQLPTDEAQAHIQNAC